jgi:integrase
MTKPTRARNDRRTNGEGSIYQTADGRWRAATIGPDGRRRYLSGRTRADVGRKLKAAQRRHDDGLPNGDARLIVAAFLDDWLTKVLPGRGRVKSTNTIDNYAWAIRQHVSPALGRHKLRALTPEHVEQMLRAKASAGMARNSVMRLRAVLVMALTHAERRGLVYRNAARLAEMPADARPPAEGRSLTVDQAAALLDAAEDDRLEALYMTGLMLGLRPGELLGLSWDDLDLEAATVQIRRALKRERGELRLGEPKTTRSRRALDLPAPVVDALRAHRRRQAEERLIAGPEWDEHGLVFVNHFGRPIDPSNLRRAFAALTKRAGLGHWHPHELRHSTASLLSAAGVPLEHVADVLGHDGTRMTAQVYRHRVAPTVGAAVSPMESMFATSPKEVVSGG